MCGFVLGFGLVVAFGVGCLICCFLAGLLLSDLFWVFVVWWSGCGELRVWLYV